MGCGDEKLSKYLTQTFTAHCNAMICQQVTLSGDAEWPKVADAVIEAHQASASEPWASPRNMDTTPRERHTPIFRAMYTIFEYKKGTKNHPLMKKGSSCTTMLPTRDILVRFPRGLCMARGRKTSITIR